MDFFEKEVRLARTKFNETFGRATVQDIQTRQMVMLAIVQMDRLARKITPLPDQGGLGCGLGGRGDT